jgi:hypothetical protein
MEAGKGRVIVSASGCRSGQPATTLLPLFYRREFVQLLHNYLPFVLDNVNAGRSFRDELPSSLTLRPSLEKIKTRPPFWAAPLAGDQAGRLGVSLSRVSQEKEKGHPEG